MFKSLRGVMKQKEFFMKKQVFFVLVLALIVAGSAFAQRGGTGGGYGSVANTSGSLTITGLDAHNGKYVCAPIIFNKNGSLTLIGYSSISNNAINLARISGGSATLKIWKMEKVNDNVSNLVNYSGSDRNLTCTIGVSNRASITEAEAKAMENNFMARMTLFLDVGMLENNVSFSGGRATVRFESMTGGGINWNDLNR